MYRLLFLLLICGCTQVETKSSIGAFNKTIYANLEKPKLHIFDNKVIGVSISVKITPDMFPDGIPSKLFFQFTSFVDIHNEWKTSLICNDLLLSRYINQNFPSNKSVWYLNDLNPKKTYYLDILLYPQDLQITERSVLKFIKDTEDSFSAVFFIR